MVSAKSASDIARVHVVKKDLYIKVCFIHKTGGMSCHCRNTNSFTNQGACPATNQGACPATNQGVCTATNQGACPATAGTQIHSQIRGHVLPLQEQTFIHKTGAMSCHCRNKGHHGEKTKYFVRYSERTASFNLRRFNVISGHSAWGSVALPRKARNED
jgi:hypothetical protein